MDYSTVLSKFSDCMTEIGNALRKANETTQKYKFTEIASAINECTQVYYLGTGTSFDVSNITGYQDLTADNFFISCESVSNSVHVDGSSTFGVMNGSFSFTPKKEYEPNTGKLTISKTSNYYQNTVEGGYGVYPASSKLNYKVYLIKGKIKSM